HRLQVQLERIAVDERPDELAVPEQMDPLRRRVDMARVPGVERIWGQELADQDRQVEDGEHASGDHGQAVALQLPPDDLPLRGHVPGLQRRRQRRLLFRIPGRLVDVVAIGGRASRFGAHRAAPSPSLIRGSSNASSRSEIRTPITVRTDSHSTKDPAMYMSWLCRALRNRGPVVWSPSTIETMVAPEMR